MKNKKGSSLDDGVIALNRKRYFKSTYTPVLYRFSEIYELINSLVGFDERMEFFLHCGEWVKKGINALPPFSFLLSLLIHIVSCYVMKKYSHGHIIRHNIGTGRYYVFPRIRKGFQRILYPFSNPFFYNALLHHTYILKTADKCTTPLRKLKI